jgi:hypothetical protein
MKHIALILLFTITATIGISQVNYKPGFIVLTNGDTIFTKIKYFPGNEMYHRLCFLDENGKERNMRISDVVMYKRDTVIYYNFTGDCFYKLIKTGCIDLYAYQKDLEARYGVGAYGQSYSLTNSNVDDGYLYKLVKGSLVSDPVRNNNMHIIIPFINDEPEMVAAIEHKTGFVNLPSLIGSYNNKHLASQ